MCICVSFLLAATVPALAVGVNASAGALRRTAFTTLSEVDETCPATVPVAARRTVQSELYDSSNIPIQKEMSQIWQSNTAKGKNLRGVRAANALEKAAKGGSLKVAVFGGSVTAGANCKIPSTGAFGHDCAWPSWLQKWLQLSYPNADINVRNLALGATTTVSSLSTLSVNLHSEEPDIIIWDYSINDAIWTLFPGSGKKKKTAYEAFIRVSSQIAPQAQIISLWACKAAYKLRGTREKWQKLEKVINSFLKKNQRSLDSCGFLKQQYMKTNKLYNVPTIDHTKLFKDYPAIWNTSMDLELNLHPDWIGHQYIANSVMSYLVHEVDFACAHPDAPVGDYSLPEPTSKDILADYPVCTNLVSFHSARKGGTPSLGPNWKLEEDVKGKPGWISRTPSANITFPLTFGDTGIAFITYLRSYKNIGKARVHMNGYFEDIDAKWNAPASLDDTLYVHAYIPHRRNPLSESVHIILEGWKPNGYNVRKGATMDFTVELLEAATKEDTKFKITSVGSC